jgi:hypothetical protein
LSRPSPSRRVTQCTKPLDFLERFGPLLAGGIYPLEYLATAVARAGGETDVPVEARPSGDRRGVLDRIRDAADESLFSE